MDTRIAFCPSSTGSMRCTGVCSGISESCQLQSPATDSGSLMLKGARGGIIGMCGGKSFGLLLWEGHYRWHQSELMYML